jgi:hypothetical protein
MFGAFEDYLLRKFFVRIKDEETMLPAHQMVKGFRLPRLIVLGINNFTTVKGYLACLFFSKEFQRSRFSTAKEHLNQVSNANFGEIAGNASLLGSRG